MDRKCSRSIAMLASNMDRAGIVEPRETLDERKVFVRAVADGLNIDPVACAANMGVAQPVVRAGAKALVRINQPDAGSEKQQPMAEVATPQKFIGSGGLRPAADLSLADLAERFLEGTWVWRRARRERLMEAPRGPMRINSPGADLVEQIGVYRMLCGEHVFPIVELSSGQWKSQQYGLVPRPDFKIVEWRKPGGSLPVPPQTPAPQLPGPVTAAIPQTPATQPTAPAAAAPATSTKSPILDATKPAAKPMTVAEMIADEIPWK